MDWDADDLDDAAGMERHRKLSRAEQVRLLLDQYQKNRDSRENPTTIDQARDDHAERLEASTRNSATNWNGSSAETTGAGTGT